MTAVRWLQRWICGLHGHDALLHFEHGRVSLKCTSCTYETPGWDLAMTSTTTTAPDPFFRLSLWGTRRTS